MRVPIYIKPSTRYPLAREHPKNGPHSLDAEIAVMTGWPLLFLLYRPLLRNKHVGPCLYLLPLGNGSSVRHRHQYLSCYVLHLALIASREVVFM